MPSILHNSLMNFDANWGSLSLMNRVGNPNLTNTCLTYNAAMSSAVAVSLHGMRTTAFVQSWSITVSIKSHPCDVGNFVMRSMDTTSNGSASIFGYRGCSG